MSWDIGSLIDDKYEVTGVLGRGGMGLVHRVRHRGWGIDLAVKSPLPELFTGPGDVGRFVTEAQAWVSLGVHPNVCCCHYVRVFGGVPRMFAEYVPGGSLADRIADRSLYRGDDAQVTARILRIAGQMARGLEHSHRLGVLHRDVKSANVLLDSGDDGAAKITDFGLARARAAVSGAPAAAGAGDQGVTLAATGMGGLTPAYASPEQSSGGSVGRRSDIYSLAVSVFEMFTGGVTWPAGSVAGAALAAFPIGEASQPGLPSLPPGPAGLLERCLSVEPSTRPASMTEVAEEFEALYAAMVPGAPPPAPPGAVELRAAEHNNRALSLLDLGSRAEAKAELHAALDADPQHVDAVYNSGLLRWRDGEITDEDLLTLIQVARERAGDPWEARWMLAQVHLERGDLPSAGEILDDLVRDRPGEPEVRAALRALETSRGGPADPGGTAPVQWREPLEVNLTDDRTRLTRRDGAPLVAGDADGGIRLWDLGLDRRDEDPRVALSHDGSQLLIRTCRWPRTFKITHVDRHERRHRVLAELDAYVSALAFTPDASAAVTAGHDHTIRVWDLRGGRCVRQIVSTAGFVSALAISGDARRLLSSSHTDGTVRLWDLTTGRCLWTVRGPLTEKTRDVWVRRSGPPPSEDETVRAWPLEPPAHHAPLQLSRPRPVAELSRLGDEVRALVGRAEETLATSTYATAYALLAQARAIPGHEGHPGALRAWRRLGRHLPRAGLRTAWTVRQLSGQGDGLWGSQSVGVSADARVAVSAHRSSAFVWDLENGAMLRELPVKEMIDGVELSADGRRVVCGSDFGRVRVWSVRTGAQLNALDLAYTPIPGNNDGICLAFTGDGRRVLLGSENGTILLWDLDSGRRVRTPSGHDGVVKALWAGVDGSTCVSAARDSVRLWDLRTGQCALEIPIEDERAPRSVCLSPRGDLIVATWIGAPGMTVWNTAGRLVRDGNALTARFSPDGRFIFAGHADGTITVLDAADGRLGTTLTGHREGVWDLRLTPDGRYALSGSHDGTIRLWELDWELTPPDTGAEHV